MPDSAVQFITSSLIVGMRVRVDGLLQAAQYNGVDATVTALLDEGRVSVTLDNPHGKVISIRSVNAAIAEHAPPWHDEGLGPEFAHSMAFEAPWIQFL